MVAFLTYITRLTVPIYSALCVAMGVLALLMALLAFLRGSSSCTVPSTCTVTVTITGTASLGRVLPGHGVRVDVPALRGGPAELLLLLSAQLSAVNRNTFR